MDLTTATTTTASDAADVILESLLDMRMSMQAQLGRLLQRAFENTRQTTLAVADKVVNEVQTGQTGDGFQTKTTVFYQETYEELPETWPFGSYIALCLGVFLLAFLAEALKATHRVQDAVCAQEAIDRAPNQLSARMRFWLKVRYPWGEQVIRTLEHTLKLGIRFLCFYICVLTPGRAAFLSMLVGSAAGYILLHRMLPPPVTVTVAPIHSGTGATSAPKWPVDEKPPAFIDITSTSSAVVSAPAVPVATDMGDADYNIPRGTMLHVCASPEQIV